MYYKFTLKTKKKPPKRRAVSVWMLAAALIVLVSLLVSLSDRQNQVEQNRQATITVIYMTNTAVARAIGMTETARAMITEMPNTRP
jgi:hypothetical protein